MDSILWVRCASANVFSASASDKLDIREANTIMNYIKTDNPQIIWLKYQMNIKLYEDNGNQKI